MTDRTSKPLRGIVARYEDTMTDRTCAVLVQADDLAVTGAANPCGAPIVCRCGHAEDAHPAGDYRDAPYCDHCHGDAQNHEYVGVCTGEGKHPA